ncbi:MAG TPA: hypothetical protein PKZ26_08860, partial [Anaerolineaceae bacterium]|nr:hypothetical protein [Anaerolineaceae bacterium]
SYYFSQQAAGKCPLLIIVWMRHADYRPFVQERQAAGCAMNIADEEAPRTTPYPPLEVDLALCLSSKPGY